MLGLLSRLADRPPASNVGVNIGRITFNSASVQAKLRWNEGRGWGRHVNGLARFDGGFNFTEQSQIKLKLFTLDSEAVAVDGEANP